MNLFATERPIIAGRPALLVDGSAVPQVNVMPQSTGYVRLSVMLATYDAHSSYAWRHKDIEPFGLLQFFSWYREDPEATLLEYFDWQPQNQASPTPKATPEVVSAYASNLL